MLCRQMQLDEVATSKDGRAARKQKFEWYKCQVREAPLRLGSLAVRVWNQFTLTALSVPVHQSQRAK